MFARIRSRPALFARRGTYAGGRARNEDGPPRLAARLLPHPKREPLVLARRFPGRRRRGRCWSGSRSCRWCASGHRLRPRCFDSRRRGRSGARRLHARRFDARRFDSRRRRRRHARRVGTRRLDPRLRSRTRRVVARRIDARRTPVRRVTTASAWRAAVAGSVVARVRLRAGIVATADHHAARLEAVARIASATIRTDRARREDFRAHRILVRDESARPVLRRRVVRCQRHLRSARAADVHRAPWREAHWSGLRRERWTANLIDADQPSDTRGRGRRTLRDDAPAVRTISKRGCVALVIAVVGRL